MKVNNNTVVNIVEQRNNKRVANNKQSFKGLGTFIADKNLALMNFIESGGFPVEFCLMDFCGMAGPRSLQGFNRNKKELGQWNVKAGLEELIREGVTGPSLFIIPAAVVTLAGWFMGQGTRIASKLLGSFSDVFKKLSPEVANSENAKTAFAGGIFDKIFEGKNFGVDLKERKAEFVKLLTDSAKIDDKDATKKFTNFMADLNARFFINENANTGSVKIFGENIATGDLFRDARKYMDDIIPSVQKTLKEDAVKGKDIATNIVNNAVDGITNMRRNGRKLMCVGGTALLAAFLCIIPKLYQLSKKNPALAGMEGKKTDEVKQSC